MDDPILDPGVLESLRQLTPPGEPDVLAQVLTLFRGEAPGRLARLHAALATASAADMHRAAHSLKGSAGNIGANALVAACRLLDDRARAGDLTEAGRMVDEVGRELRRVEAEIARLLAQSPEPRA